MKISNVSLAAAQLILLIPSFSQAQTPTGGPIPRPDLRTPAQVATGAAKLLGAYDPSQKLRVVFGLKPPRADEEQHFLEALYTLGSPEYHHFLTAKEWNERFAPSASDEQAVVDWAVSEGLTVTHRFPNRLIVDVEGNVSRIQKALGVSINRYNLNGAAVFSNNRDPLIPAPLLGIVSSVLGLNSIEVMHSRSQMAKPLIHPDYAEGPTAALVAQRREDGDRSKLEAAITEKQNGVQPMITSGLYDPRDIYNSNAYNYDGLYHLGHCCNPNHNAGGSPPETSIAIATAGAQQLSDMQGFHNTFPYLAYFINYINIDGTPTCCDSEGTMDAQWATAMANSFGASQDTAHVYVYQGANTLLSTFTDIYNQMLTDGHARVMSVSWGCAEFVCASDSLMNTQDAIFRAMAGQGWTLVADADDKGSTADCAHTLVEFPASSPNIIAAGGTELHLNSDSTYNGEIAWTGNTFAGACAHNEGGGGGGYSSKFGVPVYQAFLGNGVRTLPDIALNANFANTPQAVFFEGSIGGNGGTSIVTPELAGFFAQENAYLLHLQNQIGKSCFGTQACAPIGNANYYIYIEQQHAPNYAPHYPFYDITSGCASNDISINNPLAPYYCAAAGYDLATGLGSANMLQLAWAINYSAAGDFGPPQATFSGAAANTWYNTSQLVNVAFSDTTQSNRPPTGLAGFSLGWDNDPAPESMSRSTPGSGDAFYSGPSVVGTTTGALTLSNLSQGCHFAKAKAWDNTGTSSGLLSYGPVCYDTVAPASNALVSGTISGGSYISNVKITISATDASSGIAGRFYSLDGGGLVTYAAPITVSAPGTHNLHYFSKDIAGNTEATRTIQFVIKASSTATKVMSSLNPSTYGLGITLTAKVTTAVGSVPPGTVTFKDGAVVLGTGVMNAGQATLSTKTLHAGSHAITAVYSGGGGFPASTSAALTETISKAASITTLASSLNPSVLGRAATFTATIASSHGGVVSGTVTFKDGTGTLGTAVISASTNKAALTTSALAVGIHHITGVYAGSSDNAPSSSAVLTEIVNKGTTKTALASSANPSIYWKSVTFTATVVPTVAGSVAGTITFKDSAAVLGTAAVNTTTHQASFTTLALPGGSHHITATYGGNSSEAGSTSAVLLESVNKAATTTTLASSLNPSKHAASVTFTATITPAFGGVVSGSVAFFDGTSRIDSTPVNSVTHKANLVISVLTVGTHPITAVYSGTANLNTSTSKAVSQVVK